MKFRRFKCSRSLCLLRAKWVQMLIALLYKYLMGEWFKTFDKIYLHNTSTVFSVEPKLLLRDLDRFPVDKHLLGECVGLSWLFCFIQFFDLLLQCDNGFASL